MSFLRVAIVAAVLCSGAGKAWCQNTPRARAQFDELTRAVLPMAQELLRSHGEFPPFGAGLTASSDVVEVPRSEAGERDSWRTGDRHVRLLRHSLAKAMASGRFEATALVYEAKIDLSSGKQSEAIAIALNHRDRHATVRFFPYQFRDGAIEIGKAQTTTRGRSARSSALTRGAAGSVRPPLDDTGPN